MCVDADGCSAMQSYITGVITQVQSNHASFMITRLCFGYKVNLVAKVLSDLEIMASIESVLKVIYIYFVHSPIKYAEFSNLAILMDTKGLNWEKMSLYNGWAS